VIALLPAVNATLNATATILLMCGFLMIKRGRIDVHRRFMLSAFAMSVLFLICYVIYHMNVLSKPFAGQGPIRIVYYVILVSHILLAMTVPPLAIVTLSRGLRMRVDRHVAIARWTFPIWLYVSVTGVIVYLMLYQMY
jgi:uncharacterized membrane protein YozB (DUF420 family)